MSEVDSVTRLQVLWERGKPILQPLLFLGGVAFDYATLELHSTLDQLLLIGYLVSIIAIYGFDMRMMRGRPVFAWLEEHRDVLDYAGALVLGALLSSLAIVVLRAIYPGPAIIFVGLLTGMAIANEADVETLRGDLLRFALVGFCGFQVGSFLAPYFVGRLVGPEYGIGGGIVAVTGLLAIVGIGRSSVTRSFTSDLVYPVLSGGAGVALVVVLQGLQWIPPLPVILREAVVAHDVDRVGGVVRFEDRVRRGFVERFFNRPAELVWSRGDAVVVFTAVYAPPEVELTTVACWDAWRPEEGAWREMDCIEQPVVGGRVDGWRTWTRKENVWWGDWRVRVRIDGDREIGRVRFRLVGGAPG